MNIAKQPRKTENSHTAIDTLTWLIQEAFESDPSHSLLANLQDLREEDWTATPHGSHRSIADILEHVGCAATSHLSSQPEVCAHALMMSFSSG